jgi:hypothetical protein
LVPELAGLVEFGPGLVRLGFVGQRIQFAAVDERLATRADERAQRQVGAAVRTIADLWMGDDRRIPGISMTILADVLLAGDRCAVLHCFEKGSEEGQKAGTAASTTFRWEFHSNVVSGMI